MYAGLSILILLQCSHTVVSFFNEEECATIKKCFIVPTNCDEEMCKEMGVSWRIIDNSTMDIELYLNSKTFENVYVAAGFSNDTLMGGEPVVECSSFKNSKPVLAMSKNVGKANLRNSSMNALIQSGSSRFEDGTVYCSGTVSIQQNLISLNDPIYILLAHGTTGGQHLRKHKEIGVSSPTILSKTSDDSECSVSKHCFNPIGCSKCEDMKTSVKILDDTTMEVELQLNNASPNSYVAVGFSTNGEMGNASVVECAAHQGRTSMAYSFNVKHNGKYDNIRGESNDEDDTQATFNDGVLKCKGQFNIEGSDRDPTVFLYEPDQRYYLIMASGETKSANSSVTLKYHGDNRAVSDPIILNVFEPRMSDETPTFGSLSAESPIEEVAPVDSACGIEKGCFQPNDEYSVTYKILTDMMFEIELRSKSPTDTNVYVAVGFSPTGSMGPASVIECSSINNAKLSLKYSYNSPRNNERIELANEQMRDHIINPSYKFENGEIYCKGVMMVSDVNDNRIFQYDPIKEYQLLLAKGTTTNKGLSYHGPTGKSTSSARLLSDYAAGNKTSSRATLIVAHAVLMTVAWMVLVPIAVLFARLMRSSYPTVKPGGLLIWFHVHRTANLIGILMMIAGFVVMLVNKKFKFVDSSEGWGGVHSLCGLLAIILAWVQPFLSTLRCAPDHPKRPFFNHVHRGIGVSAMALATTAIAIAGFHFTPTRNVVQLVLALIPITLIIGLSVFFVCYERIMSLESKNGKEIFEMPMEPSEISEHGTTWNITTKKTTIEKIEEAESTKFREIVVYLTVLALIAIGTILAVFFGIGICHVLVTTSQQLYSKEGNDTMRWFFVASWIAFVSADHFLYDVTVQCNLVDRTTISVHFEVYDKDGFLNGNDLISEPEYREFRPGIQHFRLSGYQDFDQWLSEYESSVVIWHDCTSDKKQVRLQLDLQPQCPQGTTLCHYTISHDLTNSWGIFQIQAKFDHNS
ncbi:unnamed protein product [Caenorhabditis bovis]|uniref:Cytochrome b561 domain-containing protein n=1 Tax=Caenorhabditis bovis TaxID=2654633 RepID=A0A8S1ENV1_9PELO|nr:unnamed protein product [Caenorhabditis bovis]